MSKVPVVDVHTHMYPPVGIRRSFINIGTDSPGLHETAPISTRSSLC
jgi:hypothetical protein